MYIEEYVLYFKLVDVYKILFFVNCFGIISICCGLNFCGFVENIFINVMLV